MELRTGIISSGISKGVDPFLVSATVEDADPTDIVMVFNENVTGTNLGFTIGGTTSTTFSSLSGSGTNTLTGVLAVAVAFGETVTLSYNDAVGDIIDGDSNPLATFSGTSVMNNVGNPAFTDLIHAFTLRKIFDNWTRAVLKLKRSSDSGEKYVFFDGSDIISLSSFVSDSITTPSATTLGTWIGSDDGFIVFWYALNPDNAAGVQAREGVSADTQMITSGVIDTDGSLPCISFDGSDYLRIDGTITELDSGNPLTIVSVNSNSVNNGIGAIVNTTNTDSDRLVMFNDRRTQKRNGLAETASGSYFVDLSAQQNSGSQRLLTIAIDSSKNMEGWYNGSSQDTETYVGDYTNDYFRIGNQHASGLYLTGKIQEILVYEVDKTADIAAVHSNINTYYSIY